MFYYNKSVTKNGGIAQLARASGSYPAGRRFKSHYRYHFRPGGQAVKTPPFHGGNTSSILVRVTKKSSFFGTGIFLFCSSIQENQKGQEFREKNNRRFLFFFYYTFLFPPRLFGGFFILKSYLLFVQNLTKNSCNILLSMILYIIYMG